MLSLEEYTEKLLKKLEEPQLSYQDKYEITLQVLQLAYQAGLVQGLEKAYFDINEMRKQ